MSLTHLIEAKEMHITEKPEIFCHIRIFRGVKYFPIYISRSI